MIGIYSPSEGAFNPLLSALRHAASLYEGTAMKQTQRRQFLKTSVSFGAVAASAGLLTACGGGDDKATPTQNIVQIAQATPDLSILVEAVLAANLAGTLSGPGLFTVFAPSNTAFANALTELGITKSALFGNVPLLTKILTYHVLGSQVLKAQVPIGTPITTLQGEKFTVDASLVITDARARKANITATDILATNGVIHLIDKVILPAP
jgi:uncharacterized surface protein with fasciclin (FAS1) repeats